MSRLNNTITDNICGSTKIRCPFCKDKDGLLNIYHRMDELEVNTVKEYLVWYLQCPNTGKVLLDIGEFK